MLENINKSIIFTRAHIQDTQIQEIINTRSHVKHISYSVGLVVSVGLICLLVYLVLQKFKQNTEITPTEAAVTLNSQGTVPEVVVKNVGRRRSFHEGSK